MTEIIMPQVGQDIPTAIIAEWLKSEGDEVKRGEVIAIVDSDKASFEVEAEDDGILTHILYSEGEEVEVFKPIAYINGPDEKNLTGTKKKKKNAGAAEKVKETSSVETISDNSDSDGSDKKFPKLNRPLSTPAARRLARENEIDLSKVNGTGQGGRIMFADVEDALQAASNVAISLEKSKQQPVEVSETDKVIPFSAMRKVVANRMTLSKQTIPHFYSYVDVDMTKALRWRSDFNEEKGKKITITDLIVKASATALQENPHLNAWVEDERMILKHHVNIGIATSVEGGLVVPVIHQANTKTVQEISSVIKKMTDDVRNGDFTPDRSGTFTVTSLGMFGIKGFLPIINPPQCAILAVGAVEKTVVPEGVHDIMRLTLAADHRGIDGTQAAAFLTKMKSLLENLEKSTSTEHHFF